MAQPDFGRGVPLDAETTLLRLLAANAASHGAQVAMREKDRGIWQQITWAQVHEQVLGCAAGLEALGFGPPSALMVLGEEEGSALAARLGLGAIFLRREDTGEVTARSVGLPADER